MSQIPPSPGLLEYQTPPGPQQSRARFVAFILLVILGSLMILGGLCAVGGLAFAIVMLRTTVSAMPSGSGAVPPGVEWVLIGTAIGSLVLAVGSGTTYLVCGLRIRRGGQASTIVALVLASLQMLLLLALIVGGVAVALSAPGSSDLAPMLVGTAFYGLGAVYLGVVNYFLVKVLREARWTPVAA